MHLSKLARLFLRKFSSDWRSALRVGRQVHWALRDPDSPRYRLSQRKKRPFLETLLLVWIIGAHREPMLYLVGPFVATVLYSIVLYKMIF